MSLDDRLLDAVEGFFDRIANTAPMRWLASILDVSDDVGPTE